MKPEMSEKFFIQELLASSMEKDLIPQNIIKDIDRLTGDASTRRYYRAYTKNETYVVCIDTPTNLGENSFVQIQSFLQEQKIRVPQIYDKSVVKGYLLEEDLGDTTLLAHLSQIDSLAQEYDYYKKAIDIILKIHSIDEKVSKGSELFTQEFDSKKLLNEMDFSIKFFVNKFLGNKDEKIKQSMLELFKPLCNRLAAEKKVITHRDFHSRNIMIKNGEFVLIDFQDARWGIPQYDLASVLEDCYYDINEKNKEELIAYYYQELPTEIHGQQDFKAFKDLYRDMLIQRVFKAVGSFGYIYNLRTDKRYLKYIAYGMEKIKKAMLEDKKYDELRKILFKAYYEN